MYVVLTGKINKPRVIINAVNKTFSMQQVIIFRSVSQIINYPFFAYSETPRIPLLNALLGHVDF